MMLLDSKMPIFPSGPKAAGTLPNGCASSIGLEELRAGQPDAPGSCKG
jgi:hypothetical protein